MRNKNVIATLLVIFALICAYNLFYTFYTFSIESDLNSMTPQEKNEKFKDGDFNETYKNARKNSLSLGLDLQGGMFITMEVGVDEVIRALAENPTDSTFNKAIELARKKKITSQESFVDLFVATMKEIDPNASLASYFSNKDNGISFSTPDNEVIKLLKKEADDAIENTFKNIRTRIDQFGVTSPNIQLQGGSGRILLELPGVKDAERVRKLLKNTAKLEFWTTYTVEEAFPYLEKVNNKVKELKGIAVESDSAKTDSATASSDTSKTKVASATANDSTSDINKVLGKDAAAKNDSSLTDDEKRDKFLKENPFFAVLTFPNFQNMSASAPVVGYALIQDTAQVNSYLNLPEVKEVLPDDLKLFWTAKPEAKESQYLTLIAVKSTSDNVAPLEGDVIERAKQDFDQGGAASVSMTMNSDGAQTWKKLTEANIGKSIAIVMDNLVYTYPTVNNVIPNGQSQITGNFSVEEAEDLANLLKAGKLPAPARIEGEETVGPTLGESNIQGGMFSFILGFFAVMAFMIIYYRSSGLVASLALLVNLFFLLGVSAAFQIVMTLPGLAGIVLTMGMAVDANVLIYERVREELGHGKSMKASIAAGFQNAFSSIMDSNITTFLTGVVLFAFGVGPIRGFAVTLMIGIATSLVAALFVTRFILEYQLAKGKKPLVFGNDASTRFFSKMDIKMTSRKKSFYIFSGTLTVLSLISIFTFGFKQGVDFKGGRQYIVEFSKPVDVDQVRENLTESFSGMSPIIKTIGNSNQLMITTNYLIEDGQANDKVISTLLSGLNKSQKVNKENIIKSSIVGPTVASDITRSAIYAVIFSLIIIFLYILIRFYKWQYSLGALASLFHDVIIVLGLYSFIGWLDILPFSMEIGQDFIAAILTVIGYSVNDTVVVYDRVREDIAEMKTDSLNSIFNIAINQTLSRTMITSLTTILTAMILFTFGGEVIRNFIFAILFGITFGTYSSVFIASPIALDCLNWSKRRKDAAVKS
jgi:SecD/SecF fusion protein